MTGLPAGPFLALLLGAPAPFVEPVPDWLPPEGGLDDDEPGGPA